MVLSVFIFFVACKNTSQTNENLPEGIHKVTAVDLNQTSQYTYVLVKESGAEYWVAIPRKEITKGTDYYYRDGLEMNNFKSKELNKTFDKVLFLEQLEDNINAVNSGIEIPGTEEVKGTSDVAPEEKIDEIIEPVEGGLSIQELWSGKDELESKTVIVKGKVTKYNPEIMGFNWVHIQDGTEFDGHYDLTITTLESVSPGDVVVFKGTVTLNKDFGYGYFYELLMEQAILE